MRKSEVLASVGLLLGLLSCGEDDDGSGDPPSSAAMTCARGCARAQAANCPNQPNNCQQLCEADIQGTPAGCIAHVNAFAECLNSAVFSCNASGAAEALGCTAQLTAWQACAGGVVPDASVPQDAGADARTSDAAGPQNDAGNGQNDGGNPRDDAGTDAGSQNDGGSLFTCSPEQGDEPCDTCIKTACCEEYLGCDLSCAQLTGCLNACALDDFACAAQCETLYAAGLAPLDELISCVDVSCTAQCGDDELDEGF